jgi:hypothetical protein
MPSDECDADDDDDNDAGVGRAHEQQAAKQSDTELESSERMGMRLMPLNYSDSSE